MKYFFSIFLISAVLFQMTQQACYTQHGLTTAQKQSLVDDHNRLRQKLASGGEANQPGATNMMEIKWDKELENLSQGYLDTCPGMNHNPNRKTPSYSYAGENIWMGSVGYTFDAAKPVDMWYGEVSDFKNSSISPFVYQQSPAIGHYTQVVWATSNRLGCGMVTDSTGMYILCNYYEGGNMQGGVMYKTGTMDATCSTCTEGCASTTNCALCKNCLQNEFDAKITPQTTSGCIGTSTTTTNTTNTTNSTSNTTNSTTNSTSNTTNATNSTNNTTNATHSTSNTTNSTGHNANTTTNNTANSNSSQNTANTTNTNQNTNSTTTSSTSANQSLNAFTNSVNQLLSKYAAANTLISIFIPALTTILLGLAFMM